MISTLFRRYPRLLLFLAISQLPVAISIAAQKPSCERPFTAAPSNGRYWIGPDEFPLRETTVQLYDKLGNHGIKPQIRVMIPWEKFSQGTPPLAWDEAARNFPLMFYNVENLKERPGRYVNDPKTGHRVFVPGVSEKPEWQLDGIATETKDVNPLIFEWIEVEGLQNFADVCLNKLGGKYYPLLLHGNDDVKRINIGFGIRRDLKVDIELISHRNETWIDPLDGKEKLLFSRDMPALILRRAGEPRPFLILVGTHNKSQRPSPGDPLSSAQRTAQVARQAKIMDLLGKLYGADVPIIEAGDFNRDVRTGPEFNELRKAGFEDAFDLMPPVPDIERVTHTYHPKVGPRQVSQLDAAFMRPRFRDMIKKLKVYLHRDASGKPKKLPETYDERSQNPSDHFGLELVLDFGKAPG